MHMPTLTTERLVLRPLTADDLEACLALLHGGSSDAIEDCRAWLIWQVASYAQKERMNQPPYGDRAIVSKQTGQMIGMAGLVPSLVPVARERGVYCFADRSLPEVGIYYELAPAARGNGYATEIARELCRWAFASMNLARIVATTTHDNLPSRAVMERLEMTILEYDQPDPAWLQIVGVLERPRP